MVVGVSSRRSTKLRPFPFVNTQPRLLTAERNLENKFRRITSEAPALRLSEPPSPRFTGPFTGNTHRQCTQSSAVKSLKPNTAGEEDR